MIAKARPSSREHRFSLDDVAKLSRLRRSGARVISCPECDGTCEAMDHGTDRSQRIVLLRCTECGRGVLIEETLLLIETDV